MISLSRMRNERSAGLLEPLVRDPLAVRFSATRNSPLSSFASTRRTAAFTSARRVER
jgi:hypothetical protein